MKRKAFLPLLVISSCGQFYLFLSPGGEPVVGDPNPPKPCLEAPKTIFKPGGDQGWGMVDYGGNDDYYYG